MALIKFDEVKDFAKMTLEGVGDSPIAVLYTCLRVNRASVPKDYHLYEVRGDDEEGRLASIENGVLVNHHGTILSEENLQELFTPKDRIAENDWYIPIEMGFSDEEGKEFIKAYPSWDARAAELEQIDMEGEQTWQI